MDKDKGARTISDEELARLIDGDVLAARSHADTMSNWRMQMLNEIRSLPYGNEVEGRSQIVTTDIQDAIEWIMPSLMRIFAGSLEAVRVTGVGPEDETRARAVSALIYYQLQKKNDYFKTTYCWFKDALRYKSSLVKATWRYDYDLDDITYRNLTLAEFQFLSADPFVEIVDYTTVTEEEQQSEPAGMMEYPLFSTVKVRAKTVLFDGPVIENVRPETFYIDPEATSLKDADYCGQILGLTGSELKKRVKTMGWSEKKVAEAIEKGPGARELDVSTEEAYRLNASELPKESNNYEESDPRAKYEVFEHYCRMDVNGDDIVENWVVYKCNGVVLNDMENPYGRFPFFDLCGILEPHSFYGVSIAELVRDIQKVKTSLFRAMLDNMAFMVNGRYSVLDGAVKIQDLIHNNVPGGIVRTSRENAVTALETPQLPQTVFSLLEFVESTKENRTGVTRYNQGLDADSLNKTATGITTIYNASIQRIELIARIFAETGFTELVRALIDYNRRFLTREVLVRIGTDSMTVTPEDFNGYFDFDVSVGVGNIDEKQRAASLAMGLQMTTQLFGAGAIQQITAIMREWWAASGFKNSDAFVPNPANMQMTGGMIGQPGTGIAQGAGIGNGSEIPSGSPVAPEDFEGFAGANNFRLA